jgi:hypothetical protein
LVTRAEKLGFSVNYIVLKPELAIG